MTKEQYIETFKADHDEWEINENCLKDIACPKCGSRGCFLISACSSFVMYDSGTSEFGNVEYDGTNYTACDSCGHDGKLADFTIEGLDDAINQYFADLQNE